jgi:DNA-binding NarL/FixJ family response regulator
MEPPAPPRRPTVAATDESWGPVLALLARGRTDQQIAGQLGIGVRTVRRRIAEAMDEYGVRSRFELGAAWAAGSRPRGPFSG